MAGPFKLVLFGDQTYHAQPHLRELVQSKEPILVEFLDRTYAALRTELFRLPPQIREALPRFTSIADLALWERKSDGVHLVALDMAITCLYHLAAFISRFSQAYPLPEECHILGLCTGTLAASAVSCCRNVLELVPLAIETVLVAFRTGLLVSDVGSRIEAHDSSECWSLLVPSLDAVQAVQEFCRDSVLPLTSQPYISAYSPSCVTVTGPPSVLSQLKATKFFQGLNVRPIPIYAPYHAKHLFTPDDIEEILRPVTAEAGAPRLPVISSSTGGHITAPDFRSLLKVSLEQILFDKIDWNQILENFTASLTKMPQSTFTVVPFGTLADQTIYSAARQKSSNGMQLPAPVRESPDLKTINSGRKSKIAIVGMSGRFPNAKDREAFWDLLYEGLDVHKEVPSLHWDAKTHVDESGKQKNTSATPFGCWLDDPAAFDARFFNMSPREAPQVDPAQRIALMTAYEAIEQAGLVPDATPSTRRDRVGVFYGVTSNDWMETNSAQNIDTYFIPGGNRAFIPGRINYFFKFSGPSYAIDTACSSSLAAIHVACNSLWRGDIDTAIAGGTNILTNPDFTAGLDKGHFLSRTGNCKTFDDTADGYCRGEGVGTVILKRLEDALAENDPIQGVILGAYTNHSAEADSITRPHVGAQRAIFRKILNESGVDPYSVSYVECHGTGTQAGDATEIQSVLDTFAPSNQPGRRENQPLYLGSAKSNIGHGEAASGVSSLAKVLLMLEKGFIPPHCGIKTKINHKFPADLKERNVQIATKPVSWSRNTDASKPRRVFLNNFSAAGGNSALLVEDAPIQKESTSEIDVRTTHLVAISAKNGVSLQANLKSMLGFLRGRKEIPLSQLSYTTTARRIHHQHRVMLAGSTTDEICTQIEAAIRDQTGVNKVISASKLVFTFTGQGAQYPGMGKSFLENFSQYRDDIYRLNRMAQSLGFPSFLPVMQGDAAQQQITDFSPVIVQLASVCMQMALSRLWASWGITPGVVVGHSLGEFAALNVAGVLSDADTIFLVGKRAELLVQMCTQETHSMLVVNASTDQIASILKDTQYEIACINSPTETVLAGLIEHVMTLEQSLRDAGLKTLSLKVPYAFHSSQVEPILHEFEKIARGATYHSPSIPVISPLDGDLVTASGTIGPAYLSRHCREPVNMIKALEAAYNGQIVTEKTMFLEIGPHPAVSGMVKATLGTQITTLSTAQRNRPTWHILSGALKALYHSGRDICWPAYHQDFKGSHTVVRLPSYCWDLKDYWIQYVNDWSLRKGDPPLVINNSYSIESTTVHRVVEETSDSDKVHLIVEADISRPDLNPLVQGHVIGDIPLCTPSIYADIALSMGKYLLDRYQPLLEDRLVDVSDMVISKALIAKPQGSQPLQAHAEADWASKLATVKFITFDSKGNAQQHAQCVIRFKDRELFEKLEKEALDVKRRMKALRLGITEETAARFNRHMVYRMIRPLANFHADYRAIDEVVLNSTTLEATSRVSFGSIKTDGVFHTHPAIIDAFTQSCGFAMNCNDKCDLDLEVFINHGWGSCQIFEDISLDKEYTTYTQMIPGKDNLYHGDIVIFDEDRVVACFKQLAIQGVPRRVLEVILSVESGQNQKRQQTAPTISASKQSKPSTIAISAPIQPAKPSRIPQAIQIISEESAIAVSDLTGNASFVDLGIDSLLSLTITARFREELDLDLDFESIFMDYPTINEFKEALKSLDGGEGEAVEETNYLPAPAIHSEPELRPSDVDFLAALQIISEETGIAVSDLTDDAVFADMGIDSLLSLVIVSRFREEMNLDDFDLDSVFIDHPTMADLKSLLTDGTSSSPITPETSSRSASSAGQVSLFDEKADVTVNVTPISSQVSDTTDQIQLVRLATSVVLQGSSKTCDRTLFLLPDGSGSATSYASIPRIDKDTCVIALNSPYIKDPSELSNCSLGDLIEGYLIELRRRQSTGPYYLGGWSAGGILAYRIAQILSDEGDEVRSLILIDSPPPRGLDRLPQHFYEMCDSLNIFGKAGNNAAVEDDKTHMAKKKPEWLIPHFNGVIDVLHDYWADPLMDYQCPKVSLIWACNSIIDDANLPPLTPHKDDTEGMKFLTEKRTDFSGNGWEDLFPGRKLAIQKAHGANHFSMMQEPFAIELAQFIRKAMS